MHKDTVAIIKEKLRAVYGPDPGDSTFKAFYDGDPDIIPKSSLPAIAVTKFSDTTRRYDVTTDQMTEQIVIKVIFNKRDDWTVSSDEDQLTEQKIRNVVEARDATTGQYLATSLKGIIRRELGNDLTIDEDIEFRLGVLPRTKELMTHEGHVIITVKTSIYTGDTSQ